MLVRPASILAVALALGAAGCQSRGDAPRGHGAAAPSRDPATAVRENPVAYRVVWAAGRGKVGYLETREMARGPDSPVVRHVAMDLEFVEVGWVTDSGEGMRYDFPEKAMRSAFRESFRPEPLPVDTMDNQVRRLFGLDPATQISVVKATVADLRR